MSTKQDHKRWRKQFNESCLKRDAYKCRFCDETNELDVHHITDRHHPDIIICGGYVLGNGITLCDEHHLLCEEFHINGKCLPEYHPDQLYKLNNTTYEQVVLNDMINITMVIFYILNFFLNKFPYLY